MRMATLSMSVLLSVGALGAVDMDINPWDIISKGTMGAVVRLDSTQDTLENLLAAGALVEVTAPLKGEAALFGAQVTTLGGVDGDLVISGAVVQIGGEIKGKTQAAGAVIYLDGTFTDSVDAGGAVVFVRGHIKGPVMLAGAEINIDSGAVIDDTLRYSAENLNIAEGAILSCGKREFIPEEEVETAPKPEKPKHTFGGFLLKSFFGFLFLAGAGLFLSLAFPAHFKNVTSRLITHVGSSALTGGITLVAAALVPLAIGLLAVTIVGLGAVIFLIGLYLIGFIFSGTYAGTAMGRWLLSLGKKAPGYKEPHIILSMLLGTAITAVLCAVPYVGWIFYLGAFVFGFGAFLSQLWVAKKASESIAKG